MCVLAPNPVVSPSPPAVGAMMNRPSRSGVPSDPSEMLNPLGADVSAVKTVAPGGMSWSPSSGLMTMALTDGG